mmetsp:Transcript_1627/g.3484  ORF Transcript_1627/g.3484 Transcript_1627/m.3484 type:complete len:203 (+) Transcript_1627:2187-2795(+)
MMELRGLLIVGEFFWCGVGARGSKMTSNKAAGPISTLWYMRSGPPYMIHTGGIFDCIVFFWLLLLLVLVCTMACRTLTCRGIPVEDGNRRDRVTPPYKSLPKIILAGSSDKGQSKVVPEGKRIMRHETRAKKSRSHIARVDLFVSVALPFCCCCCCREFIMSSVVAEVDRVSCTNCRKGLEKSTMTGEGTVFIHRVQAQASS